MNTELNREALEGSRVAARKVFDGDIGQFQTWDDHLSAVITAAITEYLSALPSPDAGEVGEHIELKFHQDRLNSWMRELWTAKSIDVHACDGSRRENQFGLLQNIREDVSAQASRIQELEGERYAAKSGNRYAQLEALALRRAEQAEARLAQAVEALEPFAAYTTADGIDGAPFLRIPDNHPILFNGLGDDAKAVVLVKHFRAARTTLNTIKKGNGDVE